MRPMGQAVQGAPMAGPSYQVYNPSQHSGQPMYAATNHQYYQNSQQQIYVAAAPGQPIQVLYVITCL